MIKAGGYTGKYCIVDLGTGKTEIIEPDDGFYRKYLSGYGLGAAVIMERQKAGIDPLSPQSYLEICSGLLTGTGARFSGRFMVVGKSPLDKGPLKGKTIDMDNLMREFYDTVGWDLATGGPTPEKMKALEIDQLIS